LELVIVYKCWTVKCDVEIKRHKKTKDSRDEINETHSMIQFIRPYKK